MQGIAHTEVFITGGCDDIGRAVAGSFLLLASDDGAYITGATLLVDGGATLVRHD